jgi:ABC-2 type transport system permease protein
LDLAADRRAVFACFKQQWRLTFTPYDISFPILTALAPAIGAGWVVGGSGNPVAVSYVFVGSALMALWTLGMFYTGWSLATEHWQGTLDLLLATRTPVFFVILGKAIAILAWQLPAAGVSFLVVLAFAGEVTPVAKPAMLFLSGLVAVLAVLAFAFVFAPLAFLSGARAGFINALMPLGAAVSGFLYPIGLLPPGLEAFARCIPSAWAMESVVRSVNGSSTPAIVTDWAVSIALIVAYLAATAVLFRIAEARVRVTGNLGRF